MKLNKYNRYFPQPHNNDTKPSFNRPKPQITFSYKGKNVQGLLNKLKGKNNGI